MLPGGAWSCFTASGQGERTASTPFGTYLLVIIIVSGSCGGSSSISSSDISRISSISISVHLFKFFFSPPSYAFH